MVHGPNLAHCCVYFCQKKNSFNLSISVSSTAYNVSCNTQSDQRFTIHSSSHTTKPFFFVSLSSIHFSKDICLAVSIIEAKNPIKPINVAACLCKVEGNTHKLSMCEHANYLGLIYNFAEIFQIAEPKMFPPTLMQHFLAVSHSHRQTVRETTKVPAEY